MLAAPVHSGGGARTLAFGFAAGGPGLAVSKVLNHPDVAAEDKSVDG
jgi:hypothetical protein